MLKEANMIFLWRKSFLDLFFNANQIPLLQPDTAANYQTGSDEKCKILENFLKLF